MTHTRPLLLLRTLFVTITFLHLHIPLLTGTGRNSRVLVFKIADVFFLVSQRRMTMNDTGSHSERGRTGTIRTMRDCDHRLFTTLLRVTLLTRRKGEKFSSTPTH